MHSITTLTLLAPSVPGVLPPDADGQPNLVPAGLLNAPLRVQVPAWVNEVGPLELYVYVAGVQVHHQPVYERPQQPIEVLVAPECFPDGQPTVSYLLDQDAVSYHSAPLTLTVKRHGPSNLHDLVFPEAVSQGGVTDAWLKAHDDQLTATFAPYNQPRVSDVLHWYWDIGGQRTWEVGSLRIDQLEPAATLVWPGALIRQRGDGAAQAYYRVVDRAGNASSFPFPLALAVNATPIPRTLGSPQVAGATGTLPNQQLNVSASANGASVTVPAGAVTDPLEHAVLQWGQPGEAGYRRIDPAPAPGITLIEPDALGAYLEKTVTVAYDVIDSQGQAHPSPVLKLAVRASFTLRTLDFEGIVGGTITVKDLPPEGRWLRVPAWSFKAEGQTLKVTFTALDASGKSRTVTIFDGVSVTNAPNEDVLLLLPRAAFEGFLPGVQAACPLQAWVSFDGSNDWTQAKAFGRLTPRLAT